MTSRITRIGEAAPPGSRKHLADSLRMWADKVEAGDVHAVVFAAVHGEEKRLHLAPYRLTDTPTEVNITLLGGIKVMHDDLADQVREELFAVVDGFKE